MSSTLSTALSICTISWMIVATLFALAALVSIIRSDSKEAKQAKENKRLLEQKIRQLEMRVDRIEAQLR